MALHELNVYCQASGAKINTNKTTMAVFGASQATPSTWGFHEAGNSYKVLGVLLGKLAEVCNRKTWENILNKIESQLNVWRLRNLTLKGKVLVINALCISKLVHALTVTDLPGDILSKLKAIFSHFLWKREKGLVSHATLIGDHGAGGLGLIDIYTKKKSLRLKIIKKYLDSSFTAPWKDFVIPTLRGLGHFGDYNLCQMLPRSLFSALDPFEREVLEGWWSLRPWVSAEPKSLQQSLKVPLRFNPDLMGGGPGSGERMFSDTFERAGISTIGDLLDGSGNYDIVRVRTLFRSRGVLFRRAVVLRLAGRIRESILRNWGSFLEGSSSGGDPGAERDVGFVLVDGTRFFGLSECSTKRIYRILIVGAFRRPAVERTWARTFPALTITSIWANMFNWYTAPKRLYGV
ncbi:uncharacterized protein LOC133473527 [Phyllopteryx taeniolatus]|uniref:uncharacterized protein LOC133473527 n=1 Tax=Phyllopteryx taeniolatus TaxID=161469 RepID=UPI002AD2A577|nr:uncharacterized protein LOC133473527 [Phyllopteryx taeniolatus]